MRHLRKTLQYILILIITIGCKSEKDRFYTIENICDCYDESDSIGFDNKLNGCLTGWNQYLNKKEETLSNSEKSELSKSEFISLTKKLIQSCSNYQNDFDKMLLSKYDKQNEKNLAYRIDSINEKIDSGIEVSKNLLFLSELTMVDGNYDEADLIINRSIKLNPNDAGAYMIRGLLEYRKKNFSNAIADFERIKLLTQDFDDRTKAEYWLLNIENRAE